MTGEKDNKNGKSFKLYAVSKGRRPGIYENWALADKQVSKFSGAVFKGFNSERAAENFMCKAGIDKPKYYIDHNSSQELHLSGTDCALFNFNDTPLDASTPTATNPPEQCSNCHKLTQLVVQLSERLEALEQAHINDNIDKLAVAVDGINERLDRMQENNANVNNSKQPLYTEVVSSNTQSPVKRPNTSTNTPKKPTPSQNNSRFDPTKCVVISDFDKESIAKLNQDNIRRELSTEFGPIMIDLINRYKFHTDKPKLIVQFASSQSVDNVIQNWSTSLFGGSNVRKTIKPNNIIGMIHGVPIDIKDGDLEIVLRELDTRATVYRLKATDGSLLRTVKVTFSDQKQLNKLLVEGLTVAKYNMLFRVEKPFVTVLPQHG